LGEGYPHTSSINALLNEEPETPVSTSAAAAASASGSSTVQDKLVTYLHENGGVATFVAIGKSPFIKAALADARVADPKIKLLSFLKKWKMDDLKYLNNLIIQVYIVVDLLQIAVAVVVLVLEEEGVDKQNVPVVLVVKIPVVAYKHWERIFINISSGDIYKN
jgi:hypothetical protein